jgi:FYVE zinc finger
VDRFRIYSRGVWKAAREKLCDGKKIQKGSAPCASMLTAIIANRSIAIDKYFGIRHHCRICGRIVCNSKCFQPIHIFSNGRRSSELASILGDQRDIIRRTPDIRDQVLSEMPLNARDVRLIVISLTTEDLHLKIE